MKRILSTAALALSVLVILLSLVGCDNAGANPPDLPSSDGYYWESGEILFQLTDNSNSGILGSGSRKYLAGLDGVDEIDLAVNARNDAAASETRISVKYDYLPNTVDYGWGRNIDRTLSLISLNAAGTPDVFTTYLYDATVISLKNAFANLYSTDYGRGENYFSFTDPDYSSDGDLYDLQAGDGYLYEYMRSLSLADDKLYALASNYTVDLFRSMAVIPVNLTHLSDVVGTDGTSLTLDSLYGTAFDGGLTFDVIAAMAENFSANDTDNNVGSDSIGFLLVNDRRVASGALLYSSGVSILERTPDGQGGYTCSYPNENTALADVVAAVASLTNHPGVYSVDLKTLGTEIGAGYLRAMARCFADGRALFGAISMLGELEAEEYGELRASGSLAVVPVPTYSATASAKGYVFETGKVIGISKKTAVFEQCTAFLAYQSTGSHEVLNAYADSYMKADEGYGRRMLAYLRSTLTDGFDVCYDQIIACYYADKDPGFPCWSDILGKYNMCITDGFDVLYSQGIADRLADLEIMLDDWKTAENE